MSTPQFENYPKNMKELLNQKEFGILAPQVFWVETNSLFRTSFREESPEEALFLEKILLQSYFMETKFEIETLHNVSRQGQAQVIDFVSVRPNFGIKLATLEIIGEAINVLLHKFAVICYEICNGYWELPFLRNSWRRIAEKQMSFFKIYHVWIQRQPSISSFKFSKFMGIFVESGLQQTISLRHRIWRQYKAVNGLKTLRETGIVNGS
ncbi:unnamed protein product [Orchesella dallaii]|uniref:Uncharacterized protein n=1 Tax=Orchesella dallaii TaxID=48710 RepID=A0ABP1RLT7_9HEXA